MLSLKGSPGKDPPDKTDPVSLRTVALAGSFAAISAALLYCRVPAASPRSLSASRLLLLSVKDVSITVAAGIAATWFYFRYSTRRPAPLFGDLARSLCLAWLLFPALVLMFWEDSLGLLLVAPAACAVLALALRKFLPEEPLPLAPRHTLFAEPPTAAPGRGAMLASALCIHAAALAAAKNEMQTAAFLLAVTAYLLAARWAGIASIPGPDGKRPPSASRLITTAVLAILATLFALAPWLRTSSHLAASLQKVNTPPESVSAHGPAVPPADAYHAILLWPFPPKKDTPLPPLPHVAYRPGAGAAPRVIPFDGSYRYFETPGPWLTSRAHIAQGSPLNVNIHSADWGPLLMEAHQQLAAPINLACCRALRVAIRNGEPHAADIALSLVLTDSTLPGKPSQLLEPQPVPPAQVGVYPFRPSDATLTFAIPTQSRLKEFDEITVVFLPAPQRSALGSRIAISQFVLDPR